jgi:glycosyltransferase involved in cell wall biosynthesis
MRVAHVAPLVEAVPPKMYGGTERVVSWLVEELVHQGHDVTLFAAADSETTAELIPCADRGLRLAGINDHTAHLIAMLEQVRIRADAFDILHFHTDLLQFPLFREWAYKCVTTLHGRLDLPDLRPAFKTFPNMPLVSISHAQRKELDQPVKWVGNVYHGLPEDLLPFSPKGGEYLAFLGRVSPEKRPDRAIELAKATGIPLKIAAKVDHKDQAYFAEEIEPLLCDPLVEYVGEIGDREKADFLGGALALVFPIDWPEPFGLVMIEAMSTGTPVVGWHCGSVPEVIDDGITGFVVHSIEQAAAAIRRVESLNRFRVRLRFLERFTAKRMAADYCQVYEGLLSSSVAPGRFVAPTSSFGTERHPAHYVSPVSVSPK